MKKIVNIFILTLLMMLMLIGSVVLGFLVIGIFLTLIFVPLILAIGISWWLILLYFITIPLLSIGIYISDTLSGN